jgi:hypothetical protein
MSITTNCGTSAADGACAIGRVCRLEPAGWLAVRDAARAGVGGRSGGAR